MKVKSRLIYLTGAFCIFYVVCSEAVEIKSREDVISGPSISGIGSPEGKDSHYGIIKPEDDVGDIKFSIFKFFVKNNYYKNYDVYIRFNNQKEWLHVSLEDGDVTLKDRYMEKSVPWSSELVGLGRYNSFMINCYPISAQGSNAQDKQRWNDEVRKFIPSDHPLFKWSKNINFALELPVIVYVGRCYGLSDEQIKLLIAIRIHENGPPGFEFGVKKAKNTNLEEQARWAAGTIKNKLEEYSKIDNPSFGFIAYLGSRYAPTDLTVGPTERALNMSWIPGVTAIMKYLEPYSLEDILNYPH